MQDDPLWLKVDEATRARAGSLAAHGCSEQAIADILLLSLEQSVSLKDCAEYKKKYAEVADEIIQKQIDLGEGWDVVEEKALMAVIQTLEFNRDPKYALSAAMVANKAARRKPGQQGSPRVIDASNQSVVNNVINLTVNKNYVQKLSASDSAIDVTPRALTHEKRISDLPSPKSVDALLSPVREQKDKVLSELEQAFENAGVVFDSEDGN